MQTYSQTIPFRSYRSEFHLWFVGDVHAGSRACDEQKFVETIARIRHDEYAVVFLMGDLAEYIPRGEWRYNEPMVADWVRRNDVSASELDWLIEKLTPIRSKILGAIQGNHEETLEDVWNQAAHQRLCETLQIKNLGYSALVRLHFKQKNRGRGGQCSRLDLFLHHGWGGGRSDGADLNRFNELQRDYLADLYIAGHTHRYFAIKSIRHLLNHHDLLDVRSVLAGRSGTYLRTIVEGATNYAERRAMRPVQTGSLCVVYRPSIHDFEAMI